MDLKRMSVKHGDVAAAEWASSISTCAIFLQHICNLIQPSPSYDIADPHLRMWVRNCMSTIWQKSVKAMG
jgi:hypothetical protein